MGPRVAASRGRHTRPMGAGASAVAIQKRREKERRDWQEVIMGAEWLDADPRIKEPFDPVTGRTQLVPLRQSSQIKRVIVDPAVATLEARKDFKSATAKKKIKQMVTCIRRVSQMMFIDSDFLDHCFNMLGGYLEIDPIDPGGMKLMGQAQQFVTCTPLGFYAKQAEDEAMAAEMAVRKKCPTREIGPVEEKLIAKARTLKYAEPVRPLDDAAAQAELGGGTWSEEALLLAKTGLWQNGNKWVKRDDCDIERAVRSHWDVYVSGLGKGQLMTCDYDLGDFELDIEVRTLGNLTKRALVCLKTKFGDDARFVITQLNSLSTSDKKALCKDAKDNDGTAWMRIKKLERDVELTAQMCTFADIVTRVETVKVGWGAGIGGPKHVNWLIKEDIMFLPDELTLLQKITECEVCVRLDLC